LIENWSSGKRVFFHLGRLSQIKKFLFQSALAQLIHAFVISQIDNCNSLLAELSKTSLERLQRVQNAAARLLKGVRTCDLITPILLDLHWLPVAFRIDFKITFLTCRCRNRLATRYLQTLLALSPPAWHMIG
jgi:hypothetical protein